MTNISKEIKTKMTREKQKAWESFLFTEKNLNVVKKFLENNIQGHCFFKWKPGSVSKADAVQVHAGRSTGTCIAIVISTAGLCSEDNLVGFKFTADRCYSTDTRHFTQSSAFIFSSLQFLIKIQHQIEMYQSMTLVCLL